MKKLLIYLFGVVAFVVIADIVVGYALDRYMKNHRLPGDCASIDYTIKNLDEEVVILGNSVVLNSLMPSVLTDTLGMSVYNAAANGQSLDFFYTMLDCITRRHKPKVVILGLRDELFTTDGVGVRYNILAPYYGMGYRVLDSCMDVSGKYAEIMMKSTFLRYNSIWWRILLYHFVTPNEQGEQGFIAKPKPNYPPEKVTVTKNPEPKQSRIDVLNRIINICRKNGIKLIAITPPVYYRSPEDNKVVKKVTEILKSNDIPFIDDYRHPYYQEHPELFYDGGHLNGEGALKYSKEKSSQLKDLIKK